MKTQNNVKLTSRRVKSIFKKCMLQADEIEISENEALIVEGVNASYGLNRQRTISLEKQISEMVKQLPEELCNGISFKSCFNLADGSRWTSDEETVEMLFVLAVAVSEVKYVIPKHYWYLLPDQKPFIIKI